MTCLIRSDCDAHVCSPSSVNWILICRTRKHGNEERRPIAPTSCSNKHSCRHLEWFRQCGGIWLCNRVNFAIAHAGVRHGRSSTVIWIIGCARNFPDAQKIAHAQPHVLRRSTANGFTPARHLGSALMCIMISSTRRQHHSFRIYNYLQSAVPYANTRRSRYTAETVS